MNYVVVDPVLTHADNRASGDRGRWMPIKPGTDGALAMAMIRWMFENERIDSHFLSFPNAGLAKQNGEPSFSNATSSGGRRTQAPARRTHAARL